MAISTTSAQDAAYLNKLKAIDLSRCASILGLDLDGKDLVIPFYDRVYRIASDDIFDTDGRKPTDAVARVLCRYLLDCPPQTLPHGQRMTFRELKGAGPLVSSFATNTHKLITGTFAADVNALELASRQLNGKTIAGYPNYDLFIAFGALPTVSVYLQFNGADDQFPAQCAVLFDQSAEGYLDMQSLFILGTYLAGGLVRHQNH